MREELGFKNLVEEGVFVMYEPPSLLSQESIVEQGQVFETQPAFRFWLAQSPPTDPMNFSAITALTPPKFPNHTLYFLT